MKVPRRAFNCILTCFLLGGFVFCQAQVMITTPPENRTVHRGSDVTISCEYLWATALPVTWIINGTSFDQQEVANSPLYQLNNPTSPMNVSLTVFSINASTTFQCIVQSTTSTRGTVTVIDDVTITRPPENRTVNRGDDVTISCGYMTIMVFPVAWIINGRSFDQQEIMNSPLYRLNFPVIPMFTSLTVFSINGTTTFQCTILSTPSTTSTRGTVIVIGDVIFTAPPENTTVCRGSDVTISCAHVIANHRPVEWIINGTLFDQDKILNSPLYRQNEQLTPAANSLTVFSINGTTTFQCVVLSTPTTSTTSTSGTVTVIDPTPIVMANVTIYNDGVNITVSWQIPCVANIIMYNITVMDQYSPAIVTVSANMSTVEISQFPYNGTSIVANREYTITVSAISDLGFSYPSDPVVIDTFILLNCEVTSPSVGTIRVSCDSSHQILITLTCTNSCNNPMMTSNGYSPLNVTGLDPGITYSVTINVFDGNQVVLSDQIIMRNITVMSDQSGSTGNGDDSGGSSAGAIAGGVIGGIIVAIVIIIIIIVIYYFISRKNKESTYDDTRNLKSPPGTGGTHASEGDTNVTNAQYGDINVTTDNSTYYDKVVYAAPAQTATIPHQAAASGEQYAVSTKAVNKTSEEQPLSGKYDGDAHDTKKDTKGITYADLQELPIESNRNAADQEAAVTYSQVA